MNLKVSIGHVRYINIRAWLRGFRVKIANFSSFLSPSIPKRDLHVDTKKTTPNIEVWPESLGAMLEYWYIEHGLLSQAFYDPSICFNLYTSNERLRRRRPSFPWVHIGIGKWGPSNGISVKSPLCLYSFHLVYLRLCLLLLFFILTFSGGRWSLYVTFNCTFKQYV